MSESRNLHKKKAAERGPIVCAVVTVSDTRPPETDVNGKYLREQIETAGNVAHSTRIVKDEPDQVEAALVELASSSEVQVILFNGGTGVSRRDRTYDVLSRKLEKELSGFVELFRMLSFDQVGAESMMSRAPAGVYSDKIFVSIPGSPAAVKLAWEKLIGPELKHLAWEVTR